LPLREAKWGLLGKAGVLALLPYLYRMGLLFDPIAFPCFEDGVRRVYDADAEKPSVMS
jgi:hypothetical protein